MSWLYVPGLQCCPKESGPHASFLASVTEQSVTWSGKPLPPASWSRLWKRESLIRLLSGVTCERSTAQRGADAWISSLRDSPARTSALQASGRALTESEAASFSTSSTLPRIAVRGASLWRTSAPSLLQPPPLWTKRKASLTKEQPPESWENWPTAGGTRNGSLFQRPKWEPATGGQGGSASRGDGWATPDCNTSTYSNGKMGPNIREQASQWLTPNVPNGGRSVPAELVASKGTTEEGDKRTVGLESQTKHWATPNAHDGRRPGADLKSTQGANLSRDAATWPSPRATDGTKGGPNQAGSKGDLMLPSAAARWPTPASRDHKGTDLPSRRGGASLSHATQTGVFSHSSPQDQPIQDGDESSPDGHGSALHSVLKGNTTPRLLSARLNPYFAEWLMGWPMGWTSPIVRTDCARSAMESFRRKQQQHLSCLFDEHRG